MVNWLARQDEVIQMDVLNALADASQKAITLKSLKHIAASKKT